MASEPDSRNVPVIFADGIANFNNSSEFAKFYLYRFDPPWVEGEEKTENKIVPAAQIILPLESAFTSIAFLMKAIDNICGDNKEFARRWAEAKKSAQADRS